MRRIVPLLTFALAAGAVPAAAQEPAVETVALRFGWTAGQQAEVLTTRFRVRQAESTDTIQGQAAYRLRVEPHADGLLIRHDSVQLSGVNVPAASAANILADLTPSYVVSDAGEFRGLHDAVGYAARMRTVVTGMLGEQASGDAGQLLSQMLSEAALEGLAAQEWNAIVGTWVGADVDLGEQYQLTEVAPIALLPGETVPMITLVEVHRASCPGAAVGQFDCVRMVLTSRPDAHAMRLVLQQFVDRVASPGAGSQTPVFEELDIVTEVEVLARPESLRPERANVTKTVRGTMRLGEERRPMSNLDVRSYEYRWLR